MHVLVTHYMDAYKFQSPLSGEGVRRQMAFDIYSSERSRFQSPLSGEGVRQAAAAWANRWAESFNPL